MVAQRIPSAEFAGLDPSAVEPLVAGVAKARRGAMHLPKAASGCPYIGLAQLCKGKCAGQWHPTVLDLGVEYRGLSWSTARPRIGRHSKELRRRLKSAGTALTWPT